MGVPASHARRYYEVDERIELWGLQIPHTSARPPLEAMAVDKEGEKVSWEISSGKEGVLKITCFKVCCQ